MKSYFANQTFQLLTEELFLNEFICALAELEQFEKSYAEVRV